MCLLFRRAACHRARERSTISSAGRDVSSPYGRRWPLVDFGENRIEAPQTSEARSKRNLDHRQIGFVEQTLRPLHPGGSPNLGRAGSQMPFEQASEVARSDAEPFGQRFNAFVIQRTVADQAHRPFHRRP
jgi:hypothetical protein